MTASELPSREQCINAARALWGKETHRTSREMRWGNHGSKKLDLVKLVWFDHEAVEGGGAVELLKRAGMWTPPNGDARNNVTAFPNGRTTSSEFQRTHEYPDETGQILYRTCKRRNATPGREWTQQRRLSNGQWDPKGLGDCRRILYRLRELIASSDTVFICEGEKDCDNLAKLGFTTTTNPMGARKWRPEYNVCLKGRNVVILPDNDAAGEQHAADVMRSIGSLAASAVIVRLPGLKNKGDVSDWIAGGGTAEDLKRLVAETGGVNAQDFYAYMPMHTYIFVPTRDMWSAASVNSQLDKIGDLKASAWLDKNRHVEQMTWVPGKPMLVRNQLFANGGWIERQGVTLFNLYRPPIITKGDAEKAQMWIDHVHTVYPDQADHIIKWFAQRVQQPQTKINHALILGGAPGIGKDTLIEPLRQAVGPWNFAEVSPAQILERFNPFLQSTVLRINEARDLGEANRFGANRFQFYDHTKSIIAAPPDTLRIDDKNIRQYAIPNCTGVVITTNYKDGIYLPPDDRRHLADWSECKKEDFTEDYWTGIWDWYEHEGFSNVAAFLHGIDLTGFNPKAPPPKTRAFWDIVAAAANPDNPEMADLLDQIGRPKVVTLDKLRGNATGDMLVLLNDRTKRATLPHRLRDCGYAPIRNTDAVDGLWKINGKRQIIYADQKLSIKDQLVAAQLFCRGY